MIDECLFFVICGNIVIDWLIWWDLFWMEILNFLISGNSFRFWFWRDFGEFL